MTFRRKLLTVFGLTVFLSVAAVALLGGAVRTIFVLAGVGVEALGLALAIRGHLGGRGEEA